MSSPYRPCIRFGEHDEIEAFINNLENLDPLVPYRGYHKTTLFVCLPSLSLLVFFFHSTMLRIVIPVSGR